jgi:hypothetical protein
MEAEKPSRWRSPLLWGALATLAVILFGAWSFYMPACSLGFQQQVVCTSKWFYLSRATPNEVGDTLAGFAGTFAFIWIIATVAMQSQELAAQREELKLTRKETTRTADALAEQVKVLLDEQKQRLESRKERTLNALLDSLREICISTSEQSKFFKWIIDSEEYYSGGGSERLRRYTRYDNCELPDKYVRVMRDAVVMRKNYFDAMIEGQVDATDALFNAIRHGDTDTHGFGKIIDKLDDILGLCEGLADDQKIRVETLGVGLTRNFLDFARTETQQLVLENQ